MWHKTCFKCGGCDKTLQLGTQSQNSGVPYCTRCYGKQFGPKGYGFGHTTMTETGPKEEPKKPSLVKRVSQRLSKAFSRSGSDKQEEVASEEVSSEEVPASETAETTEEVASDDFGEKPEEAASLVGKLSLDDQQGEEQGAATGESDQGEESSDEDEKPKRALDTNASSPLNKNYHVSMDDEERLLLDKIMNPEKYMDKPKETYKRNTMRLKCWKCAKSLGVAEMVKVLDKKWHKTCFRCESCAKVLSIGSHLEHAGEPYCKSCYQRSFAPKGYGYGVGAGIMQSSSDRTKLEKPRGPA